MWGGVSFMNGWNSSSGNLSAWTFSASLWLFRRSIEKRKRSKRRGILRWKEFIKHCRLILPWLIRLLNFVRWFWLQICNQLYYTMGLLLIVWLYGTLGCLHLNIFWKCCVSVSIIKEQFTWTPPFNNTVKTIIMLLI